jgi:hypothetical protein
VIARRTVIGLACVTMPAAIGLAFAFLHGACNGILTISRGTLPLVLFDHQSYGRLVGALIMIAPSTSVGSRGT